MLEFSLKEAIKNAGKVSAIKRTDEFVFIAESLVNDSKTTKRIELPSDMKGNVVLNAYCLFSGSPDFINLSASSQKQYAATLNRLVEFFKQHDGASTSDDKVISVHYLYYSSKTLNRSREATVGDISRIKCALKYACDHKFHFKKDADRLEVIFQDIPKFGKSVSQPKPTLMKVFQSDFTDTEIIESLRHVLTWFCLYMKDIRTKFLLKNEDLAKQIFHDCDDGKSVWQNNVMKMTHSGGLGNTIANRVNGYYLRAMLDMKDPLLNEMLLMSQREFARRYSKSERFTPAQVQSELEAMFTTESSLKRAQNDIDRTNFIRPRYRSVLVPNKTFNGMRQSVFPIGFMFTSSLSERRALSWLIASDRVQSSGFDRLTLKDGFLFDGVDESGAASKLQIKFPKIRSKSREFLSPIYAKGEDLLFDVYMHLYQLRIQSESIFAIQERPGFAMPTKSNVLYNRPLSTLSQTTALPLCALGLKGTQINKFCRENVANSEPFLSILEQSTESGTAYLQIKNKKTGEANFCDYKSITMDLIAQTRAVLEDEESDDEHVSAESSAHSLDTHKNVYIDRSDISQKTDADIHNFASRVGGELYKLAKEMGELKRNEPNYHRSRVMEKLELSTPSVKNLSGSSELTKMLSIAKKSRLGVSLFDELRTFNDKIIIDHPLCAALIIKTRKHIENIRNQLEKGSPKVKVANTHLIYLNSLLDGFHSKTVKEGEEIAHSLKLPVNKDLLHECNSGQ